MRDELIAVMASDGDFEPYVSGAPDRPPPNNHLLGDPSWGAYYLWQSGAPVAGQADRCPATMAALAMASWRPRIRIRWSMGAAQRDCRQRVSWSTPACSNARRSR
jgi:hypothetical protein